MYRSHVRCVRVTAPPPRVSSSGYDHARPARRSRWRLVDEAEDQARGGRVLGRRAADAMPRLGVGCLWRVWVGGWYRGPV